jgi:signal transduction histidine kinase
MESRQIQPESLFPAIAAQIRGALSTFHLAAVQAVPPEARDQDPELDRKAAVMDQSYYRLLRLVNLLSAAALPEDAPLSLQNRDLTELVGDICDRAGDLAQSLGLEVRFSCALPRHVCAVDAQLLEQLLFHLLSNAFKFTPSGGTVTVELRVHSRRVLLSVTDTGQGIPPERLASLFDGYLHMERQTPAPCGMGLGLSLCRKIAERHGGMLMAESQVDKGSRFTLSLPDRQVEGSVSDVPFDYAGGFNRTLLALADALPVQAFLIRNQS